MIMAAFRPRQVDLLSWPAIHEAELRAEAAEAARASAHRRWRLAPHGEIENRLKAFKEASQAALAAEVALQQLREDLGA
jgi:RPA family protein